MFASDVSDSSSKLTGFFSEGEEVFFTSFAFFLVIPNIFENFSEMV